MQVTEAELRVKKFFESTGSGCIIWRMDHRYALAFASFALLTSASHAQRFLGWSVPRGGESSLAGSPNYSSTRAMISTNFPSATIGSADTITTAGLEDVDIVWLGSTASFNSAINPLTNDEQAALLGFVNTGGTVVVFADNDTYSPTAPVANNSLVGFVGAAVTGTLSGFYPHTILAPTAHPFTGPFGTISSITSGYPGWFTTIPSAAVILSTKEPDGVAFFITIPPDGLGAGSGRCWLFSDSGQQGTGGAQGDIWNTLFANMIAESTGRVSGQITLENMAAMVLPRTITLSLVQGTTTLASGTKVMTSISDAFSLRIPVGVSGAASLTLDGSPHLRRRVDVTLGGSGFDAGTIVVSNGDVDDSGEVDAADIDAVIADFGDVWPNGDGNPSADVDDSGEVDAADVDTVIGAFGSSDQ